MATINLRDIYPYYNGDVFVDIPDEVLDVMEDCERKEEAYKRYLRYHKVTLALDADNARHIEADVLDKPKTPHEIIDGKVTSMLLHQAITQLPDKQAKRIYAHYLLGISKADIALAEGVSVQIVRRSIINGIKSIRKNLMSKFY